MTQENEYHNPVLLEESVDALDIMPGGVYVDATFGGGGHSREILSRMDSTARLYSFDQDADAERNIVDDDRFTFVRSNFRYLENWMRYYGIEHIDGILADLGVSSHHFDDETRGFSFRFDAPIDMRMNKRAGKTAADILNDYTEEQLADIFYIYGELKTSRRIAAAIAKARAAKPIKTTTDLLTIVDPLMPKERQKKDLAKVFQALRIEVNREMEALKEMLTAAVRLLRPGGRLSVITYHSLEDRMVKNVMKTGNVEGKVEKDFFGRTSATMRPLQGKPITPSAEEQTDNPRSRSAKLRVGMKNEEGRMKSEDMKKDNMQEGNEVNDEIVTAKPLGEAEKKESTFDKLRQSVSEEDDMPASALTLKTILGGDILYAEVLRKQLWLIVLVVFFTIIYVAFRYQCQQDMIAIDKLETELKDAKYKALSSSSTLTERCRESHVLEILKNNKDSLLKASDQPPYIINVPEE